MTKGDSLLRRSDFVIRHSFVICFSTFVLSRVSLLAGCHWRLVRQCGLARAGKLPVAPIRLSVRPIQVITSFRAAAQAFSLRTMAAQAASKVQCSITSSPTRTVGPRLAMLEGRRWLRCPPCRQVAAHVSARAFRAFASTKQLLPTHTEIRTVAAVFKSTSGSRGCGRRPGATCGATRARGCWA